MKLTQFRFSVLLTTFVMVAGCVAPKPVADPLSGWKSDGAYKPIMVEFLRESAGKKDALGKVYVPPASAYEQYAKECPFGQLVVDDYQGYIKKRKFDFLDQVEFFEDGTGQHAVRISAGKSGTYSTHILIYDKSNPNEDNKLRHRTLSLLILYEPVAS